jgi:hypothetical protein
MPPSYINIIGWLPNMSTSVTCSKSLDNNKAARKGSDGRLSAAKFPSKERLAQSFKDVQCKLPFLIFVMVKLNFLRAGDMIIIQIACF